LGKSIKDRSKRLPLTQATDDGGKYGVGISLWLMKVLRNVNESDQFWQDPKLPVIEL
jgi:hypothetical protein